MYLRKENELEVTFVRRSLWAAMSSRFFQRELELLEFILRCCVSTSTTTRFPDRSSATHTMCMANVFHARSLTRSRVYALKRIRLINDFWSQRFVTLVFAHPILHSSLDLIPVAVSPVGFIFFSKDTHGVLVIDNSHLVIVLLVFFVVPLTNTGCYRRILCAAMMLAQSTILV